MFLKITGTRNIEWCPHRSKNIRINDTQDIWLLNTDYIVGISGGRITLSCYVENAFKEVVFASEDTDTHSFYIPLTRYHTVKTEIWSLGTLTKMWLLNRSKEEEQ